MTTRGLPGFLRRTRRIDFEESDDEDDNDADDKDKTKTKSKLVDDVVEDEHPDLDPQNDDVRNESITSLANDKQTSTTTTKTTTMTATKQGEATTTWTNGKTSSSWTADVNGKNDNGIGSTTSTSGISSRNAAAKEEEADDPMDNLTSTLLEQLDPQPEEHSSSYPGGKAENDEDEEDDVSTLGASEMTRWDSFRSGSSSHRRRMSYRDTQLAKVLNVAVVKLPELRKLAWNGIPPEHRGTAWKLLLGYLPTNQSRRTQTLERKRAEYRDAKAQHYDIDDNSRTLQEQETLRQVLVDVPRTAPDVPLFRNERIRRALARLLYIWAMRHPASSYVQGINDLATPLFAVFLSDYYNGEDVLDGNVMVVITDERLDEVEADAYWCLTNILAGIQDHYTADQPGVQRMVMRLEDLVQRIDANLCRYLESVGIQFMQFAFKWMNCLLLREFHLRCVIRLWDTYLAEESAGFEDFHVYVCAAFLCQFSAQLQTMDFDELFGFMQQVPTEEWGEMEIEMLLSQAYVLSTLFGGSEAHLNASSNRNNGSLK